MGPRISGFPGEVGNMTYYMSQIIWLISMSSNLTFIRCTMQMLNVGLYLASSLGTVFTEIYAPNSIAIRQTRSAQRTQCPQQLVPFVGSRPHETVLRLRVGATRWACTIQALCTAWYTISWHQVLTMYKWPEYFHVCVFFWRLDNV